jgi:hypothetical protein
LEKPIWNRVTVREENIKIKLNKENTNKLTLKIKKQTN